MMCVTRYNGDIGVVTALLAANADVSMANVDGITGQFFLKISKPFSCRESAQGH